MNEKKSKVWELSKEDWLKTGKGLLIALGGAALTYFEGLIPNLDFGVWTPAVMALNCALVNLGRKFLTNH